MKRGPHRKHSLLRELKCEHIGQFIAERNKGSKRLSGEKYEFGGERGHPLQCEALLCPYSLSGASHRAEALFLHRVEFVSMSCFYVLVTWWPPTLPLHLSYWRLAWYQSTPGLESGPKLWSVWLEPRTSNQFIPVSTYTQRAWTGHLLFLTLWNSKSSLLWGTALLYKNHVILGNEPCSSMTEDIDPEVGLPPT